MEPSDAMIEILNKIQAEIAGLRGDTNDRLGRLEGGFADVRAEVAGLRGDVLDLRRDVATTNETLGLIHHRLQFAEAASGAATSARTRLDDRMDRLEARVDAIEGRGEPSEG